MKQAKQKQTELQLSLFLWKLLSAVAIVVCVLMLLGTAVIALASKQGAGLAVLIGLGGTLAVAILFGLVPWTVCAMLKMQQTQTEVLIKLGTDLDSSAGRVS
jgi:uncharacterized membrane protein